MNNRPILFFNNSAESRQTYLEVKKANIACDFRAPCLDELPVLLTGYQSFVGIKEIAVLQTKPTKQSDRALAIDRSLLAKQVVSVDDPRWLKQPNRYDVRGIDTPGSGRVGRTGYTDKGKQRMSRRHHRGWKKVKFA